MNASRPMRAVVVERHGGPEVLQYRQTSQPLPGPDDALIRIAASGVNFIDVYHRKGSYAVDCPFIPGVEAAGVVEEIGGNVRTCRPGDRVGYAGPLGAYAEYAAVPAERLVPMPAGVDERTAAALLEQGMTAHYLSHSTYPVQHGDVVLVHAAAGGVGRLLAQLCKLRGATVIATASTDEKAAIARSAGADHAIVYTRDDFRQEALRLTHGRGVHAVFDSVGADTFEKSLGSLKPRGFMVLFGASSGQPPPFDLARLATLGSLYVTRPTLQYYVATREELLERARAVFDLAAAGKLDLRIDKAYPLADAQQAHRDLESRKTSGKLLLLP